MSDRVTTIMGGVKTLLDATSAFQNVWTYDRVDVGPLPAGKGAATMWFDGFEVPGDIRRTVDDDVTRFRIILRVIARMAPNTKQTDEANFRALVEATVDKLRSDRTLNGTCLRSKVVSGQTQFDEQAREVWMDLILLADRPDEW